MRDDRAVLSGIRSTIEKMGEPSRVLGDNEVDEIAGMYSQEELNRMVNDGVLSGTWTSTKKDAPPEEKSKEKDSESSETTAELKAQIAEMRQQIREMRESSSSSNAGASAFPADYPGFDVLGQIENLTREKLEAMTDAKILDINGIGPQTLKAIRAYGK